MTQYAKAQTVNLNLDVGTPGIDCFTKDEMEGLVKYRNKCEINALDLKDTKATLKECHDKLACNVSWWQEKPVVIALITTFLITGYSIGVATSRR